MALTSIGDLSASYFMRSRNAGLQGDLSRLTQELASGQTASVSTAVDGNFRTVSGLQRSLDLLDAYETAGQETSARAEAVQTALDSIRTNAGDLTNDLLLAASAGSPDQIAAANIVAEGTFESTLGKLNSRFADAAVFGGLAPDSPAITDPSGILVELRSVTAGDGTASDVLTTLDAWFAPGGGFDAFLSQGSMQSVPDIDVSPDRSVSLDVTAASTEIRDTLKGLAAASIARDGLLASQPSEQTAMISGAAEILVAASDGLIGIQAQVGEVQNTTEQAIAEVSAESASTTLALSAFVDVDPYDTATQLEQVEAQIQMLYALTARLSNLKLSDYL